MTENAGYDPFGDDAKRDPGAPSSRVAKADPLTADPMDELLAAPDPVSSETTFGADSGGWDPVQEESFTVRSLDLADLGEVANAFSAPIELERTHSNPLPGMKPATPAVTAEQKPGGGAPAPRRGDDYHHSNEAILSGVQTTTRQGSRAALPTRDDAPRLPETVRERRPVAWLLPLAVLAAGGAAGWYLCTELNPVIGSIAMALGAVGAMLLRVTLKR